MSVDLLSILNIIFIDIILGGDNAVVIALACRRLPETKRNKAIFLGTGLAVILRILLTAVLVSLLNVPFLLFIGGIFLIIIAIKLLINHDEGVNVRAGQSLFSAVRTIVFADLVMGLDNILAIAGASKGHIGLVAIGLIFSVPIIVWGSKLILIAMEKIPGLTYIGGGVLGYTASEMITEEPKIQFIFENNPHLQHILMTSIIVSILIFGWAVNVIKNRGHERRT
ncbi:YjbE family putative metal transport protein [Terrilactibacillus sp. BCM23-1]|uniref:YjbE family putative metal transport protein n=1 Tax=Terrilactibacillus tamarindi TaxID=2599694 RepID=A0A6N8CLE2_9BACI|nr:TerC family protein [Terrilactibacillus tamarindi]MTT30571.1 YjbE family putative metal transport protein [Terrilactibacillus tamarindi]